jgi:flavodoxin I
MMNVSHVHDKVLIVYYSLGGNTKGAVKHIIDKLNIYGQGYDLLALPFSIKPNIEAYQHVFIGSPTYGDGNIPEPMLDFLRYILKFNEFNLPSFSIFGTGDTQWKHYCRAVDEIKHHLSKNTKVIQTLKIEQYPISHNQIQQIKKFVELSIGGNHA